MTREQKEEQRMRKQLRRAHMSSQEKKERRKLRLTTGCPSRNR